MNKFRALLFHLISIISGLMLGHNYSMILNFSYEGYWNNLIEKNFIDRILYILIDSNILWVLVAIYMIIMGFRETVFKHEEEINNLKETHKIEINKHQEEEVHLNDKICSLHEDVPDIWLKMMFEKFNFSTTVRASIYFMHKNNFHLLSRHSDNPEYKETHTPVHKKGEGILYQIWINREAKDKDCPPPTLIDKYVEYVVTHYNYDEKRVRSMTMKSCRYLGVRIDHSRDGIGLLLVESLDKNFFELQAESDIIDYINNSSPYLTKFVLEARKYQEKKEYSSTAKQETPEEYMKLLLSKSKEAEHE